MNDDMKMDNASPMPEGGEKQGGEHMDGDMNAMPEKEGEQM